MADEKTTPKFDARVPLDWSSSVTRALAGDSCPKGSLGGTILETGCGALDALCETFGKALDAKRALHAAVAVPLRTGPAGEVLSGQAGVGTHGRDIQHTGREAELGRSMDLAFNKLAPKVEGALKTMRAQREKLEAQVDAKMDRLGSKHARDVAYHFERNKLPASKALDIITNGDEDDAAAVAAAFYEKKPSFLSPFKKEAVEAIRSAARARFAKAESAQLSTAARVISQLEASRDSFVKRWSKERPKARAGKAADAALEALVK